MRSEAMIDNSPTLPTLAVMPPAQNIAFAVNYSEPLVEQFDSTSWRPQMSSSSPLSTELAALTPTGSSDDLQTHTDNSENKPPKFNNNTNTNDRPGKIKFITNELKTPSARPKRERKQKEAARNKDRVRYDMSLVPAARRSREFIQTHVSSWQLSSAESCYKCQNHNNLPSRQQQQPFSDNASIVWIPNKRADWEDCVSELTAVCTSAAFRRRADKQKPFHAPLSSQYITDRIDIDDPLNGIQIRHRGGGWLQGFILWTNFTNWTHYFKWDSLHPSSGVAATHPDRTADLDGSISKELESQPRSGDPLEGGVVFSTIAEISLVGGMGCGEYLLRMAIDDIMSKKQYNFVALQATDTSRTFYERFGFVRVGAVSTYGNKNVVGDRANVDRTGKNSDKATKYEVSDIVGYRHWTYAHETSHSLDLHGGPSYMMVLRLPAKDFNCGKCPVNHTFCEEMMKHEIEEKPKIMQLGSSPTPASKKKWRTSYISSTEKPPLDERVTPNKKRVKKKNSSENLTAEKRRKLVKEKSVPKPVAPTKPKSVTKPPKRVTRKSPVTTPKLMLTVEQRAALMTPPPPGKTLTYAQKQYQSVWLAVPPTNESGSSRKPPRRRDSFSDDIIPKFPLASISSSKTRASSKPPRKAPHKLHVFDVETPVPARKRPRVHDKAFTLPSDSIRVPRRSVHLSPFAVPISLPKSVAITSTDVVPSIINPAIRKQRVVHNPNNAPHKLYYYNKVVVAKNKKGGSVKKYFFVLNYDEKNQLLRTVPLLRQGMLSGKRQGRPRYKVALGSKVGFHSERVSDYKIVPAYMVTKTSLVTNETWDIL